MLLLRFAESIVTSTTLWAEELLCSHGEIGGKEIGDSLETQGLLRLGPSFYDHVHYGQGKMMLTELINSHCEKIIAGGSLTHDDATSQLASSIYIDDLLFLFQIDDLSRQQQ